MSLKILICAKILPSARIQISTVEPKPRFLSLKLELVMKQCWFASLKLVVLCRVEDYEGEIDWARALPASSWYSSVNLIFIITKSFWVATEESDIFVFTQFRRFPMTVLVNAFVNCLNVYHLVSVPFNILVFAPDSLRKTVFAVIKQCNNIANFPEI